MHLAIPGYLVMLEQSRSYNRCCPNYMKELLVLSRAIRGEIYFLRPTGIRSYKGHGVSAKILCRAYLTYSFREFSVIHV